MAPFPMRSPSPDTLGPLPALAALAPAKPHAGAAWPWPPVLANGAGAAGAANGHGSQNNGANGHSNGSHGHAAAAPLPPFRAGCPPLIAGGGVFGNGKYAEDNWIFGREPFDVIRLAFAYGIRCLDTSAYYYPSEVILGRILRVLAPEYPRASYYLSSKCGRFGPDPADFDYRPQRIRECVATSLRRLGTEYLDVALLHDVEFVADPVGPSNDAGFAARDALSSDDVRASLGLAPSDWGVSHGKGDEACIAALAELFALKDAGVVRNVGISGYPLPVLLRISRLAFARLGRPLDALLSYSNHALHCDLLPAYVPLFAAPPPASLELAGEWKAPFVMNGGPFSMGLLTSAKPPWHPASPALQAACDEASQALEARGKTLAATALRYGIKSPQDGERMPTMVGMASVQHVHAAAAAWRSLQQPSDELEQDEQAVLRVVRERQVMDLCWSSP